MKKSFLLLVMACFWLAGVFAQTGAIENLQVAQRTDGSGLVDIHFDLNGAGASYSLQFEASFDDGANYEPLSEPFLTGELTDVLPGTGKHIIWAGKASHPETFSTQTRVRVIAIEKTTFECGDPLIDQRDGNSYATVQIGNQCWMAENLRFMPSIAGPNDGSETIPYYYVYGYDGTVINAAKATANYQNYGVLYNWPASISSCPDGWNLASDPEWTILVNYVVSLGYPNIWDDPSGAGNALKSCRQVNSPLGGDCNTIEHPRWNSFSEHYGFDEFGFSAFPGGYRHHSGNFLNLGYEGPWWSSTEVSLTGSRASVLQYENGNVYQYGATKQAGFSVRCLKDESFSVLLPTVATETITEITSNSSTSGGNVTDDGGAPVTARGVVWSTNPNPTLEENEGFTNDGEGEGEFTSEITGLQPETIYYVRAYAENSVGVGYGDELSFSTTEWQCGNKIFDQDGNYYNTVLIGEQCWMRENLKTTKYSNNTPIEYPGSNSSGWENNTNGAYAWYENDIVWKDIYGALYNWFAVNNANGLCPTGWHVPTDAEFTAMINHLGVASVAGGKMKSTLTVPDPHPRWESPNTGATNESDWSGLPGGYRFTNGTFYYVGLGGSWWSSTENVASYAWYRFLYYYDGNVSRINYDKTNGFSVRCLKDTGSQTTFNLILEVSPANAGIVTGESQYEAGEPVNITAEANPGWKFVNWADDDGILSEAANFTYTMPTADVTLTANFVEEQTGFTCGDPLVDARDGQPYTTVQIGAQCWMAENLNIGARINGNQEMTDNSILEKYCYDNSEANCDVYGGLYQWNEMMQYSTTPAVQGICPEGWYIPTDQDWKILEGFADSQYPIGHPEWDNIGWRGSDAGTKLKSTTGWFSGGNGNDIFGFNILPSGEYHNSYNVLGSRALLWSSDQNNTSQAYGRDFHYQWGKIGRADYYYKIGGLAVRCIKDDVLPTNQPPSSPSNPSPETGSINQTITPTLTWDCSDPEGDPLTYDVYFGTDENPPLVAASITEQTYTPATLQYSTTYFWKIVAHDDQGNSTEGEIWSFTTLNADGQSCPGMPTITDIDGNVYNTVQIGNQCWMKENLKTTKYRNNTPIEYPGSNNTEWQNNTTGAFAWYDNNLAYKNTYGALYNWHALNNSSGLCPSGWHEPSDAEWTTLTTYLGGESVAGGKMKEAGTTHWNSPNTGATNSSGFTALPGGHRSTGGWFGNVGSNGNWWSSSQYDASSAWFPNLYFNNANVYSYSGDKSSGFSVRCLKDN